MKKSEGNRKKALREIFGQERELLTVPQEHTNTVGVDAIITRRQDVAVGVFVADCVPLLLADSKRGILAAAHAGWKGTLGAITKNTVEEMKKLGSNPKDIRAWIGPHIGMCHYDVREERAKKFLKLFDNDPKAASFFEGSWHVDIGWANYRQLIDAGVTEEHISAPPTCTACQVDTYFSYRKYLKEDLPAGRQAFGEIMGVIGFT